MQNMNALTNTETWKYCPTCSNPLNDYKVCTACNDYFRGLVLVDPREKYLPIIRERIRGLLKPGAISGKYFSITGISEAEFDSLFGFLGTLAFRVTPVPIRAFIIKKERVISEASINLFLGLQHTWEKDCDSNVKIFENGTACVVVSPMRVSWTLTKKKVGTLRITFSWVFHNRGRVRIAIDHIRHYRTACRKIGDLEYETNEVIQEKITSMSLLSVASITSQENYLKLGPAVQAGVGALRLI